LTPPNKIGDIVLSYDRHVPDELLSALEPKGWAHSLVEYGRSGQYALDLQLRGYATKSGHWATLYVGLTKVVDLHYRPSKGFHLDVHPTFQQTKLGWQPTWRKPQSAKELAAAWPLVEDYLERAIPTVGVRFLNEGAVQSAISGFATQDMVVIDREATVTFSNQKEKNSITQSLAAPVLAAIECSNGAQWWRSAPTSLGNECDALAVTKDGDLLAIEIKPARATKTIRWSPLQARHYANLFAKWANDDADAPAILQRMVDQRVGLGLVEEIRPRIRRPIRVRPVIAIGRGYSKAAINGLIEVQQRLIDAGCNDPPLEIKSVTLAGRLDPVNI